MGVHLKIFKATDSKDELPFLTKIASDLNDHQAKLVYADWLEEQGDKRGAILRQLVAEIESNSLDDFDEDEMPTAWLNATGTKLFRTIIDHEESSKQLSELVEHALPCLNYELDDEYEWSTKLELDPQLPVGTTKIFGLPDLPPGTSWPKQKDCNTFYDPNSGIEPETNCGFVCQINFADFAGTQVAQFMPSSGLLSIFSCAEFESIGMVDGFVMFTQDTDNLERAEAPESLIEGSETEDEANLIRDAVKVQFTEGLDIPTSWSDSPFPPFKHNYDEAICDELDGIRYEIGCDGLDRIMGFTRQTSGDDPLPGKEWCQLICVTNTCEMKLHFCIKLEDLKAAKFDEVELAWVDFD